MTGRRILGVFLVALAVAAPALAGPPLLCHPFDIGSAKSLPWDGRTNWFQGQKDYSLARLADDTDALLQPSTPTIVRMETLRRASIYASGDAAVAATLIARLTARARTDRDGLAALDAAYLIGALDQITMLGQSAEFRDRIPALKKVLAGHDAAPLVAQAAAARPSDPTVAFAAALIVAGKDRQAYDAYRARARAGASKDALLSKNLHHVS